MVNRLPQGTYSLSSQQLIPTLILVPELLAETGSPTLSFKQDMIDRRHDQPTTAGTRTTDICHASADEGDPYGDFARSTLNLLALML